MVKTAIGKIGLLLGVGVAAFAGEVFAADEKHEVPNIVLIFADDLGYGDLSCYGQTKYKTPELDRMAREGVRLTDFYVASPACSPSRASLLTGQYPLRTGVSTVLMPKSKRGLFKDAPLLPRVLKDQGYMTAIVGKWHLGHQPGMLPLDKGFDRFFGLPYSNDMKPSPLYRNHQIVEKPANQDTLTQRYTEEAVTFIGEAAKAEKPFFLYFAHTFPHVPLHVSSRFKGASKAGLYGDVITELDWSVGQVLKCLNENKLAENTLVIFTSDNGPWTIKKENGGETGGLRGAKGTDYEGGIRVPFIAWWPGKLKAGTVISDPVITLDMMPTLAALAKGKLPDAKYDGVDIWPLLSEGKAPKERAMYFPDYYPHGPVGAVRHGDYKLILSREATQKFDARTTELFNLRTDKFEKHDISAEHPELVKELADQAKAMEAEFIASKPKQD